MKGSRHLTNDFLVQSQLWDSLDKHNDPIFLENQQRSAQRSLHQSQSQNYSQCVTITNVICLVLSKNVLEHLMRGSTHNYDTSDLQLTGYRVLFQFKIYAASCPALPWSDGRTFAVEAYFSRGKASLSETRSLVCFYHQRTPKISFDFQLTIFYSSVFSLKF